MPGWGSLEETVMFLPATFGFLKPSPRQVSTNFDTSETIERKPMILPKVS
jgi:hypothetical protein